MPTVTLADAKFPVAQSVGIYPAGSQQFGAPPTSAVIASASVDAAGLLTVTNAGILQGVTYVAYALVNGEHRYVRLRSTLDASDTGKGSGTGTLATGSPIVNPLTATVGAFAAGQRISGATAGILPAGTKIVALASNRAANATVTATAATDIFSATAHGYFEGDPVVITGLTGGAGITAGALYYVRAIDANTFKVATTPGGNALDVTSNLTGGTITGVGVLSENSLVTGSNSLVAEGASPPRVPPDRGVGALAQPTTTWQAELRQRRQLIGTGL